MVTQLVIIFIQDSKGRLFVHQRSKEKKISPLLYGLGAGGHVDPEETLEQAAQRELWEELRIKAPLTFHSSCSVPIKDKQFCTSLFLTKYDGDLSTCDEWEWSGWMTQAEVDKLAAAGKLCPDTKILYEQWKANQKI